MAKENVSENKMEETVKFMIIEEDLIIKFLTPYIQNHAFVNEIPVINFLKIMKIAEPNPAELFEKNPEWPIVYFFKQPMPKLRNSFNRVVRGLGSWKQNKKTTVRDKDGQEIGSRRQLTFHFSTNCSTNTKGYNMVELMTLENNIYSVCVVKNPYWSNSVSTVVHIKKEATSQALLGANEKQEVKTLEGDETTDGKDNIDGGHQALLGANEKQEVKTLEGDETTDGKDNIDGGHLVDKEKQEPKTLEGAETNAEKTNNIDNNKKDLVHVSDSEDSVFLFEKQPRVEARRTFFIASSQPQPEEVGNHEKLNYKYHLEAALVALQEDKFKDACIHFVKASTIQCDGDQAMISKLKKALN